MADLLPGLVMLGYTQICAVHGAVSWPGEGDGAGQLQLWCHEGNNDICAGRTARDSKLVCELLILMFYSFTSKSALKKSKRY